MHFLLKDRWTFYCSPRANIVETVKHTNTYTYCWGSYFSVSQWSGTNFMTHIPPDPQAARSNQRTRAYTRKPTRNLIIRLEMCEPPRASRVRVLKQSVLSTVQLFIMLTNTSALHAYAVFVWDDTACMRYTIQSIRSAAPADSISAKCLRSMCACALLKLIDAATHTTSLLTFKPPPVFIPPSFCRSLGTTLLSLYHGAVRPGRHICTSGGVR